MLYFNKPLIAQNSFNSNFQIKIGNLTISFAGDNSSNGQDTSIRHYLTIFDSLGNVVTRKIMDCREGEVTSATFHTLSEAILKTQFYFFNNTHFKSVVLSTKNNKGEVKSVLEQSSLNIYELYSFWAEKSSYYHDCVFTVVTDNDEVFGTNNFCFLLENILD